MKGVGVVAAVLGVLKVVQEGFRGSGLLLGKR